MTLFQFLRYVLSTTPIALYDISGQVICKVQSKNDLSTDLLDYKIFRIIIKYHFEKNPIIH